MLSIFPWFGFIFEGALWLHRLNVLPWQQCVDWGDCPAATWRHCYSWQRCTLACGGANVQSSRCKMLLLFIVMFLINLVFVLDILFTQTGVGTKRDRWPSSTPRQEHTIYNQQLPEFINCQQNNNHNKIRGEFHVSDLVVLGSRFFIWHLIPESWEKKALQQQKLWLKPAGSSSTNTFLGAQRHTVCVIGLAAFQMSSTVNYCIFWVLRL